MNIAVAPGSSFRRGYQADGRDYTVKALRRKCACSRIKAAYAGYDKQAIGRRYQWVEFLVLHRAERLINHVVTRKGRRVARFGIELCADDDGPFLSVLYFEGKDIEHYADRLIIGLERMAWLWAQGAEPRLHVRGRKGWRRWLKRRGIEMDEDGMIHGWQEGLHYGW